MPDDRPAGSAMRPSTLAFSLMACAGALTGLALARPTPMTVANAMLFWAWAMTAMRFAYLKVGRRVCAACGSVDPPHLPDGSCAACAAPLRRSFPDLANSAEHQDPKGKDRPATSW